MVREHRQILQRHRSMGWQTRLPGLFNTLWLSYRKTPHTSLPHARIWQLQLPPARARLRQCQQRKHLQVSDQQQKSTMTNYIFRRKYREHNAYVNRYCPKERLLVMNVKDGWAPLIEFLEMKQPDAEFPFRNKVRG